MASTISAGTTTSTALNFTGDTSGNLQLQTQAGTNTITVPNVTGTMMVSGDMPAFSAYQSTQQSVPNATFTKVQYQTKEFDTASCFDNTTNYRFTPNVSGYYQINGTINFGSAAASAICSIFKNGSEYKRGTQAGTVALGGQQAIVSSIVYFNGSTDYVEIWCYQGTGLSNNTGATSVLTYFNGVLIRTA